MKNIKIKFNDVINEYAKKLYGKLFEELTFVEQSKAYDFMNDSLYPKWKPIIINGNNTGYMINNIGVIMTPKGEVAKLYTTSSGYKSIWIHIKGKQNNYPQLVHRLVAVAFIPNPDNKLEVNHIDSNKENNWVGNLEWVTHQENINHAIGLGHQVIGINHKNAKCTEKQINAACKLLENPYIPLSDVSKITGVPMRTLKHIRNGSGWKHISSKYNINTDKRIQGPKFSELSRFIKLLILSGKSNDDIYKIIKSDNKYSNVTIKTISNRIYHIRKTHNS